MCPDEKKKTLVTASGDRQSRTVVSPRYYLADAAFLVGIESGDRTLPATIHAVLRAPVWPLALGRKSFPPGWPVYPPDGLREMPLIDALSTHPRLVQPTYRDQTARLRFSIED